MEELKLNEIQDIELNLLIGFDRICRENGFRYSLGGGTLLGGIRHKGFIPWDDDVDVMMPRPDYENFIRYAREHQTVFRLISYEDTPKYTGLFAKIFDPSTKIEDEVNTTDYPTGIYIDVFPLDGLGMTEKEAVKRFRKTSFKREVLNAVSWKKFTRSKTHSILLEPVRLAMFLLSRMANPEKLLEKIDAVNRGFDFEKSGYAGCVCGCYREKEIMKTDVFRNFVTVEFEGRDFMAIRDYDDYLKMHYGDYMLLPPEEKRQTHHTYKAYRV
ncbi:MAG: LicD family protein [Lachnospiraceae bacterium]|nr:LicD family protein [Lachnospiraceae bacterium]